MKTRKICNLTKHQSCAILKQIQAVNIREYRRCSESETERHRLKAFRMNLLEPSVWEPSGEKRADHAVSRMPVQQTIAQKMSAGHRML